MRFLDLLVRLRLGLELPPPATEAELESLLEALPCEWPPLWTSLLYKDHNGEPEDFPRPFRLLSVNESLQRNRDNAPWTGYGGWAFWVGAEGYAVAFLNGPLRGMIGITSPSEFHIVPRYLSVETFLTGSELTAEARQSAVWIRDAEELLEPVRTELLGKALPWLPPERLEPFLHDEDLSVRELARQLLGKEEEPAIIWEAPVRVNLLESVRGRPHMYFGDTHSRGAFQAAAEVIANALDQFLLGAASHIRVHLSEWEVSVWDDGNGFPLDKPYLEEHHFTPTADRHAPHVHLVTTGIGLAPVNAASSHFLLETIRDGRSHRVRYAEGQLQAKEEDVELDFQRGTRVTLHLDRKLFQEGFPQGSVRRKMFYLSHLCPGVRLSLNEETFYSQVGLLDLADFERSEEDFSLERFGLTAECPELKLNVAFAGRADRSMVRSWVNGAETPEHGTHVEGALSALAQMGWTPAIVLVHVVMREPRYAGPVKRRLDVRKVRPLVRAMLESPLKERLI